METQGPYHSEKSAECLKCFLGWLRPSALFSASNPWTPPCPPPPLPLAISGFIQPSNQLSPQGLCPECSCPEILFLPLSTWSLSTSSQIRHHFLNETCIYHPLPFVTHACLLPCIQFKPVQLRAPSHSHIVQYNLLKFIPTV